MDSTTATATPPITYPTLTIAGKTYDIRFTLNAMWQMEEVGLDPAKLHEEMTRAATAGRTTQTSLKLLACMLGQQQGDEFMPAGISAERLSRILSIDQLAGITATLVDALVKARPAASSEPAAPADQAPKRPN